MKSFRLRRRFSKKRRSSKRRTRKGSKKRRSVRRRRKSSSKRRRKARKGSSKRRRKSSSKRRRKGRKGSSKRRRKRSSSKRRGKKRTALHKKVKVSDHLAVVVGGKEMPRTEVTKKVWKYIKKHKLQKDPNNGRMIHPDAKLGKVIGNKPIDMMKMTAKVSKHMK